jgi:hypothetical protein
VGGRGGRRSSLRAVGAGMGRAIHGFLTQISHLLILPSLLVTTVSYHTRGGGFQTEVTSNELERGATRLMGFGVMDRAGGSWVYFP